MIIVIAEAALRSLALAAPIGLAVWALRIRNAHLEKAIWTTVLVGALAMPALMQWLPPSQMAIVPVALPDVSIHGALAHAPVRWLSAVAVIYALVTLTLLLRFTIALWRVWQLRRGATRLDDEWTRGADVRVAANLPGPVTFAATILLPLEQSTWSDTRRLAILAHEREHVRTRDCYVQWLAALHVCIFWFSPLSWWLRRHLAALAEYSSDDAVLRERVARADYAAVLLEAAQARANIRAAISIASGSVEERIDRVLSGRKPDDVPGLVQRVLAVALLLPAVALAANAADGKAGESPAQAQTAAQGQTPAQGHAQATASPAKALFGMDNAAPHIVSTGPPGTLALWYPKEAKEKGTQGLVHIAVTLDAAGRATDTVVLSEVPDGVGFAAAASGVVHEFTYANPTGHLTTLTFNVKFELDPGQHFGTTNFESPQQPPAP